MDWKIIFDVLFLVAILYYIYRYIEVIAKMKKEIILPTTMEEMTALRINPQKTVDPPVWDKQKVGFILYFLTLLFIILMYILGIFFLKFDWSFYLLLLLPLSYSNNLLNMLVVVNDGILIGGKFIAWKKIQSFHCNPINLNHPFYGYSDEVNIGYELKIKGKVFSNSCIVTSNDVKEKLTNILSKKIANKEEESIK